MSQCDEIAVCSCWLKVPSSRACYRITLHS